jgi:crotonobetainyl-CoA:carnitine CoA-transferase CaiB-like acyl-CoA transferase
MGNAHPNLVPYQVFAARDGHVIIATGNDRQFKALCAALDLGDCAADPRFASNAERVANREDLCARIEAATARMTKADLLEQLGAAGIPVGPINTVAEALSDRQMAARGMVIEPEGIPGVRTPIRLSDGDTVSDRAAPVLGGGNWRFADRD